MTRPLEQVRTALILRERGLGARRIARATGIPVKTVQGWLSDPVRALLRPPKSGLECQGSCRPWEGLARSTYSYLLGSYLGDGHIVRVGNAYRLSIYCDPKYTRILDDVEHALRTVIPKSRPGRRYHCGCIAVSSYSQHWPCFFPQHGEGRKHERSISLHEWQESLVKTRPRQFLRGLIHSDGWRGENVAIRHTELAVEYRRYTRYLFTNESADIRNLFCWACDFIGVNWTQSNRNTISVARRRDVHYLDSFIGPKR